MVETMNNKNQIGNFAFQTESDNEVLFEELRNENGITEVKIRVNYKEKIAPEPLVIRWTYPCKNVFSQWNPALWSNRTLNPNWMPIKNASRSAESMPIQTHLSLDGKNIITVSLNDTLTPIEIATGILEETAEISYKLTLFTKRVSPINLYETVLRLDTREKSYIDVVNETTKQWYDTEIKIPEYCNMPMYSTWYAYHQKLEHGELINELRLAKQYGMESVIIDDGWQTDDGKRGYAYCGDWKPVKLSDMKQFVSDVHEVGMKCIVWFGVPFVGIHSEAWGKFQGKFLNGFDEKHPWCVLDPRYPDVREYLIDIYKNAVSEWGIDGLKLDFINNMHLTEHSSLPNDNMDFESLEDAICELLSEIKKVLSNINPEIMIEFRQPYIGPIMRKYGNMLRVADCPMDALKNRAGIVDLKMTSGNTAVHSDMLMWNYDDTPESAALQIINIMFGVPQISVLIENLSEEHKKVLKFYLSLWNVNRECLVDGKLSAQNPETGYSFISSETETMLIAASYVKNILKIEKEYKKVIFVNGSWDEKLLVDNNLPDFNAEYNIYNCMGEIVSSGTISIINGINCFEVPNSGMLELHIK